MSFSSRHGFRGKQKEITVREDAPGDLRAALPMLAEQAGLTPKPIREIVCAVLLKRPDPDNWSERPNIWNELNALIEECEWYKVYDIAEAIYEHIERYDPGEAGEFEERLNQFFVENGIGWAMIDGEIVFRGSEVFTDTTGQAAEVLEETGHSAAAREVHEALRDISRRPDPDITGAIQHVIAALECTARDVTGKPKATLGQLSSELGLTEALGSAVSKLYGFASDRARHIREGESVSTEEAELVVSVACALCIFLASQQP